jgi:5-(carboxyamino)imidazole ribonucleotide mutase
MVERVKVAIIMGSASDQTVAAKAQKLLDKLGISYDVKILSAHRTPAKLDSYLRKSPADIFIGIAGLAAHLPGYIASRTKKPVIGVPVAVKLNGLDALLSSMQMPPGVPVVVVGIDNGENAAWMAARILALKDKTLQAIIEKHSSS